MEMKLLHVRDLLQSSHQCIPMVQFNLYIFCLVWSGISQFLLGIRKRASYPEKIAAWDSVLASWYIQAQHHSMYLRMTVPSAKSILLWSGKYSKMSPSCQLLRHRLSFDFALEFSKHQGRESLVLGNRINLVVLSKLVIRTYLLLLQPDLIWHHSQHRLVLSLHRVFTLPALLCRVCCWPAMFVCWLSQRRHCTSCMSQIHMQTQKLFIHHTQASDNWT